MRKQLLGVAIASVLALGMTDTASALTAGFINSSNNQGVVPVYGSSPRAGWFGANLFLFGGPATIEVSFYGAEAGYKNVFTWGANSLTTPGSSNDFCLGVPTFPNCVAFQSFNVAAGGGLLPFLFNIDGGNTSRGILNNGSNAGTGVGPAPDFFVSFAGDGTRTSGKEVDIWLDDGGTDDNHDDMMIKLRIVGDGTIGVVPIPAALPLLLSGLAGLGFISRRRRVVAA